VEQIVRPTGIIDPAIEVRETRNQIDDLMNEIRVRTDREERTLVTTLTKKMSEDLTDYLLEMGFRVRYLHSEIDTLERIQIIRQLRLGEYDVLVGVNLLREGLDLPEVSMVAILDADKAGFLRSETSLIQTIGRAARNVDAKVILYADTITPAMQRAMDETSRRRKIQHQFNIDHGITPKTIEKSIRTGIESEMKARRTAREAIHESESQFDQGELIRLLEEEMLEAAKNLEFERAAQLRDKLNEMKGVPIIKSGRSWEPEVIDSDQRTRIWQPKSKGRGKRTAK
jgi:excinuclease ABC subunit B